MTHDIVKPIARSRIEPRRELLIARLTTLGVGGLAIFFALTIRSVLDILLFAYNFWAPVILVPLVGTLLGVRATKWSFAGGAIAGIAGTLAWNATLGKTTGVDGLLLGVFCNTVLFSLIATVARKPAG